MTEWISVKDRLPPEESYCWIYRKNGEVLDGLFKGRCVRETGEVWHSIKTEAAPAFCIDEETGNYLHLEDVSHWTPYFTPEPPKE